MDLGDGGVYDRFDDSLQEFISSRSVPTLDREGIEHTALKYVCFTKDADPWRACSRQLRKLVRSLSNTSLVVDINASGSRWENKWIPARQPRLGDMEVPYKK